MLKNRHMSKKIDIIGLYLEDYHKSMSGREIAKKAGINHQTALMHLNWIVKDKIVSYKIKGRNKEYALNLQNHKTRIMIEIAENSKALQLLNQEEIGVIIPEMMEFAESLILYGSFASGTSDKKSDMDIIVIGRANKPSISKMKKTYTREINIEYAALKEFREAMYSKKPLAIEVLRNHAIFGNVSGIIDVFWEWYRR